MKTLHVYSMGMLLMAATACTSLSVGQEAALTGVPDPDRRVRYRADPNASLRERMNGQSSEINRKHNIEEFDRNGPAMTPPALRPQQLPNAPVDSTTHNVQQPLPTRVEAIDN